MLRINVRDNRGAIKHYQFRDTGNTLGTQDTGPRQTKQKTQHKNIKKMSNTDLTKNREVNSSLRDSTPAVLLIYTVKSC